MNFHLAALLTTTLWAGAVLGISFVAQPAKFRTPQLPRPIALAAGRQMFRAMHWTESALAVVTMALMLAGGQRHWTVFGAACLLLAQVGVLMPALSRRVDARLAGAAPAPSAHHGVFAALELAKFVLLLAGPLSALLRA